ncbi:hypothetical protein BVRB_1g018390 [Beta vulgaris subsp. vulgaris]|uniref:uncharacterized protein LOC104905330 n=1 Tax=Beta vulgaris subsp. vulgaris TaxID=3555 RepID=UPI00053F5149|nr:uncharacterized protein LOC104905330 [Beta vulgaris subsp. vulgaris]KMT00003.1 hypothetical protein BVRB_1g018390 [Beta vulgaris subsp. vulgaris]
MADQDRVCCMCGDIGFADKLFQCPGCRFRFQHLYCSNYYSGNRELSSSSSSSSSSICDWCRSEGRNSSTKTGSFKRSSSSSSMEHNNHRNLHISSEYTSGERIKQHQHQDHLNTSTTTTNNNNSVAVSSGERGTSKNNNNNSGVPSPRPSAHRRYKLLKDVMC